MSAKSKKSSKRGSKRGKDSSKETNLEFAVITVPPAKAKQLEEASDALKHVNAMHGVLRARFLEQEAEVMRQRVAAMSALDQRITLVGEDLGAGPSTHRFDPKTLTYVPLRSAPKAPDEEDESAPKAPDEEDEKSGDETEE